MRFVVLSSLSSLLLVLATPASAEVMAQDKAAALVEVCRKDLTMYMKGDKTWLERKLVTAPPKLRDEVINSCKFYSQGVLDALVAVEKARRKNIT